MSSKKMRYRIVSLIMVVCMLCAFSMPTSAIVISPDTMPAISTIYSVSADKAAENMLNVLEEFDIAYEADSVVSVETTENGSILHVATQDGDTVTECVLLEYAEDEAGTVGLGDFAKDLVYSPMDGGYVDRLFSNVYIKAYTVYTRYDNGSYVYVRPTGQYFTCYDRGGSQPTSVTIYTQIRGTLYNTSFTVVSNDYIYSNSLVKSSPAFNTMYSESSGMSSSRWILPLNSVSYQLHFSVEINGTTYNDYGTVGSWV